MKLFRNISMVVSLSAASLFATSAMANQAPLLAGGGSSAMFQSFAQAARGTTAAGSGSCGNHIWTKSSGATIHDVRSSGINNENGNVWVVWDDTAEPSRKICVYVSVDSAVGVRGFMAVPKALVQILSAAGTAGDNLVQASAFDEALPAVIHDDINLNFTSGLDGSQGSVMNAAFTDIRPEDSQFATWRALVGVPAAPLSRAGLGYSNTPWSSLYSEGSPIGFDVKSSFGTQLARPVNFHIGFTATDPITGQTQSSWNTTSVGAAPVVIIVSNNNTASGGLGSTSGGNYVFNNANTFSLGWVFDGTFGLTRDLLAGNPNIDPNTGIPANLLPAVPMTVITREPLSGTYNTFEFTVPRSYQVQRSQEDYVVPTTAGHNPLNISTTEAGSSFLRLRAIGTGQMAKAVAGFQAVASGITSPTPDKIGYLFWAYGNVTNALNAGNLTGYNVHYLQLNGVDPLYASYSTSGGNLPTCNPTATQAINPPCPVLSFPHVVDGSYPSWTTLRVVTGGSAPSAAIASLITAAQNQVSSTSDFVPVNNLGVFRSHRGSISGVGARNGHECPGFDTGAEVGGAIFPITADVDYFLSNGGAYGDCGLHEIYEIIQ